MRRAPFEAPRLSSDKSGAVIGRRLARKCDLAVFLGASLL